MVLFKINGERNSGTNFLTRILNRNKFPKYVQKINGNIVHHWKHGIPSEDYKELDEKVVDLFLFRNLEDWLISFSKNHYHLKKHNNFKDFLTLQQISHETKLLDYRTNECLNKDDNGKTVFQIREYKFNKIMDKDNFTSLLFGRFDYGLSKLENFSETGDTQALKFEEQDLKNKSISIGALTKYKKKIKKGYFLPYGRIEFFENLTPDSEAKASHVSDPNTTYYYTVKEDY